MIINMVGISGHCIVFLLLFFVCLPNLPLTVAATAYWYWPAKGSITPLINSRMNWFSKKIFCPNKREDGDNTEPFFLFSELIKQKRLMEMFTEPWSCAVNWPVCGLIGPESSSPRDILFSPLCEIRKFGQPWKVIVDTLTFHSGWWAHLWIVRVTVWWELVVKVSMIVSRKHTHETTNAVELFERITKASVCV